MTKCPADQIQVSVGPDPSVASVPDCGLSKPLTQLNRRRESEPVSRLIDSADESVSVELSPASAIERRANAEPRQKIADLGDRSKAKARNRDRAKPPFEHRCQLGKQLDDSDRLG